MRIVISDTSPLHYLLLVDAVEVLPKLYSRILIPRAVLEELSHTEAPEPVRDWLAQTPLWLETATVSTPPDPSLSYLDAGESEAIRLALELNAGLLLMDDRKGAEAARRRGLTVVGTLGVLDRAAERGLIDLPAVFSRLQQTTFRFPPELIEVLLRQDALRKQQKS